MTKTTYYRSIILLILLIGFTNVTKAQTPTAIITFNNTPGIYFEEIGKVGLFSNEWKIIIYYDLENLRLEFQRLQEYSRGLTTTCELLRKHHEESDFCNGVSKVIQLLISDIEQKESLLRPKQTRYKRGLFNAVGTLSKTLFGTLDENDAKMYAEKINELNKNDEQLLKLIKNHTSIIETTVNICNRSRMDIDQQFLHIENKLIRLNSTLNNIRTEISHNKLLLELESSVTLVTVILVRHQLTINTLIDLLTNVKHGKPHPSIITPSQMQSILTEIHKNIPSTLSLPLSTQEDNLLKVYQLAQTRAGISEHKIIFELKLPLPFKETYQLFKVIPLPTPQKDHFAYIQPTLEYLVVDYNREHYYALNKFDLSNCLTNNLESYLCRIIHPIFNDHSANNICEIKLLKHAVGTPPECEIRIIPKTNYWIQLSQPNSWIFVLKEEDTVDFICGNTISPLKLKGAGIIEIKPKCYLRSKEFIIQAHNIKSIGLNNYYLPANNLSINFTSLLQNSTKDSPETPTQVIKFYGENELRELSKTIQQQHTLEEQGLPKVNGHIIHHYTVSYILLAIVLFIITYILKKRFSKKFIPNTTIKKEVETKEKSTHQLQIKTERNIP